MRQNPEKTGKEELPTRSRLHAAKALTAALSLLMATALDSGAQSPRPDRAHPDTIPWSFAVWGHARGNSDGAPPRHFGEVLDRLAALKPDLLITTGDMIWGAIGAPPEAVAETARRDLERLDEGLDALGIPVFRVPGNHDVHNIATRDVFLERYREPPYAFTHKQSRFILLDTLGIRARADDPSAYWGADAIPLDAYQLDFLKQEMANQYRYEHVFLFIHHADPWIEQSGFWWSEVHPLLTGGKVRAVFSGSPWSFKYAHLEKDGIHYILSSSLAPRKAAFFRTERGERERPIYYQPDNLQYVSVTDDGYEIQTIVVGALETETLSPRFWDEVDTGGSTKWLMVQRFREKLASFRSIVLFVSVFAIACLALGFIFALVLTRRRGDGAKRELH